jgi:thymidine phosphorylase
MWSGRGAHLVGGTLDFLQALLRYRLERRRAGR